MLIFFGQRLSNEGGFIFQIFHRYLHGLIQNNVFHAHSSNRKFFIARITNFFGKGYIKRCI